MTTSPAAGNPPGLVQAATTVPGTSSEMTAPPGDTTPTSGATSGPTSDTAPSTSEDVSDSQSADNAGLNSADLAIASAATKMELALRDLYLGTEQTDQVVQFVLDHEGYATRIAGIAGIPSTARDEEMFTKFSSAMSSDPQAGSLAVENAAAANYVAWVGQISDSRLVRAFASIAMTESRQAALVGASTSTSAAIENPELPTETNS